MKPKFIERASAGIGVLLLGAALGCGREGSSGSSSPGHAAAAPDSGWVMPMPDAGYAVREGRALFRHYCATCHGDEGHGDGFNAYSLDPKPRDLADSTFQVRRSDEELAAIIRSGGGAAGMSTGMPPWGRMLDERNIGNIVKYLRTLRAPGGSSP